MSELPTGTITFLFTDIQGSTRLLEGLGDDRYASYLEQHDGIVRTAANSAGGVVVHTIGDGFFIAFTDARSAVEAATAAQRALYAATWPDGAEFTVRMGLHTGRGIVGAGNDYVGLDVHRAARIADAGHGGQVLVSNATAALIGERPGPGVTLRDLGRHRLKDVSEPEHLFQLDISGLQSDFPRLRTVDIRSGNLPSELTSFIGRTTELEEARRLAARSRLLTLTGPGGTGKTRLALRLASDLAMSYPDGAYFVALEAIADPDLVAVEILDTLGLKPTRSDSPPDQLVSALGDKHMLLILDNFEQVLGAAPLVANLLAGAPHVTVIVTSRAPLHIRGERELQVPPLATPVTAAAPDVEEVLQLDAVKLFADRAMAVRPDFQITIANANAVANLTTALDGLPLAIELAASRVKLLPVEAMIERLGNRLLEQPSADLPDRQRTITNAIGWSYDLLNEPARRLFERCSVFVGSARLQEIEAVCGPSEEIGADVLDTLGTLVDQSLLVRSNDAVEPRFRMLTVVRDFAHGAVVVRGEIDEVRRRHAEVYAELAQRAEPQLLTTRHRVWRDRLMADHDNLRAALDWAIEVNDANLASGLVADLWRFWQTQGHLIEARERVAAVLIVEGAEPYQLARALEADGGIKYWMGDWVGSRESYDDALRLMRDHGGPRDIANALYNASFGLGYAGEIDGATGYLDEALELFQSIGDHHGIGRVYWGKCNLASYVADHDTVVEYAAKAVAEFDAIDAPFDSAWAWFMQADAQYKRGDLRTATSLLQRAIPYFLETRDLSAFVLVLYVAAAVRAASGDALLAARLVGAADALAVSTGSALSEIEVNQYPDVVALRDDPGKEIRDAIESGRRLTTDEAIALALDVP
jgi:predicted ATPase/class 3 adenylate cyclase